MADQTEIEAAKQIISELTESAAKCSKELFVTSAEDLVQQYYGTREGKVLQIAVEDAQDIDLEWLQDRIHSEAYEPINKLQATIECLVSERDEALAEVENLRSLLSESLMITKDSLESNKLTDDEPDCECEACERFRSIISRIEAALSAGRAGA